MDINNNKNLSLSDYLSFDFSSNSSKSNSSFDEIYSKSSDSNYSKFKDDKYERIESTNTRDKKKNLKDRINSAKDKFEDAYDKVAQSNNEPKDIDNSINDKVADKVEDVSKVEKTKDTEKTEEVKEFEPLDKNNLTDEEKYKLSKIANILGVSLDKLISNMNELKLGIEDLADGENVKDLLMSVNGFLNKAQLLSFNNLKETVEAIQNVAEEEVSEEDIQKFLNDMKNTSNLGEATDETANEGQSSVTSQTQVVNSQNSASKDLNSQSNNESSSEEVVQEAEVSTSENTEYSEISVATKDASVVGATVNNETLNTANNGVEVNNDMSIGVQSDIKVGQSTSFLAKVAGEMGRSNVDTESVVKQLTDSMKVEVKGDVTNEIKIALRPSHLGDVILKIINDNGIITAQFEAESQRVKEIIESNFNQLKQSLEEQGVNIANLEVNVRSEDQNNASLDFGKGNSNDRSDNGQNGDNSGIVDEEATETIIQESVALGSTSSFKA